MADLAKLIAGGLALGVGWFVWSKRQPALQPNDVVTVPVQRLLFNNGPVPGAGLVPSEPIALQVVREEGGQVSANAVGTVDKNDPNRILRVEIPIGVGPFGFARGDVIGVWRGDKRIW